MLTFLLVGILATLIFICAYFAFTPTKYSFTDEEFAEAFFDEVVEEDEPIKFLAYRLETEDDCMGITEHLSMNGYKFDTNCEKTIFIFDEEACYLETILEEHGIKYCVL